MYINNHNNYFKHFVKRSHSEACSLKKAHCPIMILFCILLYFEMKSKSKNELSEKVLILFHWHGKHPLYRM